MRNEEKPEIKFSIVSKLSQNKDFNCFGWTMEVIQNGKSIIKEKGWNKKNIFFENPQVGNDYLMYFLDGEIRKSIGFFSMSNFLLKPDFDNYEITDEGAIVVWDKCWFKCKD